MYEQLIVKNNTIYNQAHNKPTFNERVLWDDAQKQIARFDEIYNFIGSGSESIIDIGCGNGELLSYIHKLGHTGSYSGIDVNENLITEAKERFKQYDFHLLNILEDGVNFQADNTVISGLFNLNFGQDLEFIQKMLKKAYELSDKKLIFNAISTHVNYTDGSMFYIDPSKILDFCIEELSPIVTIRHGYLSHNYTVCVEKSQLSKKLNLSNGV